MKPPPFLAAVALAVAAFPFAGAADFPASNLGFESWDANGKPEGWWIGSASSSHVVSAECDAAPEGKCALKIESRPGAPAGFQPLAQSMPLGAAAGHRMKLSGFIRTRDVSGGWAALWLRVDAARMPSVLENMANDGPRGTTDWKRFEISVPVAPNAKQIAFGVFLNGSGVAWFDDLQLAVDESEVVPKLDIPETVVPPRPRVSQSLADDAALTLAPAEMPKVKEEWRLDAHRRAQPIRSLFSDRFDDLQFLKPLLKDKRVVQLGESGHGVAEFNWLKVRLVKFLHQEMGFDVVAFESSLSGCAIADTRIGGAPAADVMRDCIFPVWHTSETVGLFEYLNEQRKAGKRITLAGFDTQSSGRATRDVSYRLTRYAGLLDAALADQVDHAEKRLAERYGRVDLPRADAEALGKVYRSLGDVLSANRDKLRADGVDDAAIDLAIQEAKSRSRFVVQQSSGTMAESGRVRDEGMADNLDFLLDKRYPGRKVIVWAHNFHIAKQKEGESTPVAMGAWVAQRRAAEVYTIGLFMGRGAATQNDRSRYAIDPPPEGSLEAILANAGWRMSFIDLSRTAAGADAWMNQRMTARQWGTSSYGIVPAKAFDGVIYVDTVSPPDYQ